MRMILTVFTTTRNRGKTDRLRGTTVTSHWYFCCVTHSQPSQLTVVHNLKVPIDKTRTAVRLLYKERRVQVFYSDTNIFIPWVPETFLAQFPVSVKSLWWLARKASGAERYCFDGADPIVSTVKSVRSDFGYDGWLAPNNRLRDFESIRRHN